MNASMTVAINLAAQERDHYLQQVGGCGNGYCLIIPPKGQHTNGSCKCFRDPIKMQRFAYAHNRFAETVRAIVEAAVTARPILPLEGFSEEDIEGVTAAIKNGITSGEIIKLPDTATPKGIRLSNIMRDGTENGTYDVVVEVLNAQGRYVEAIREFGGHMEVSFDHFVTLPLSASASRTNLLVDTTDRS